MQDHQGPATPVARQHDIGPAGTVIIATDADDVRVRGVDGTTVRLVAPATDRPGIEVAAGPGRYAIALQHAIGGRGFGFRFGSRGIFALEVGVGTLELEVPHDARVEISAGSGDVNVRDLNGSLAVRTLSGDVSVRGGGGDLRVEATSGNLRAACDAPLAAAVRTVSGDVEIDAPLIERASITTVSGDVEIASAFAPGGEHVVNTTTGDVELAVQGGLTIDVRTVSGDVDCTHPGARGGTGRRGPLVIGDGAARLAVRTLSGDIEVRAGRIRPQRVTDTGWPAAGAPPQQPTQPQPTPPPPPVSPQSGTWATPGVGGGVGDGTARSAAMLVVLEALARGDIDVAEAERRLAIEGRSDA